MKKFELVRDKTTEFGHKTLYRVKVLRSFGSVKKGDLDGFVERETNLSHSGLA